MCTDQRHPFVAWKNQYLNDLFANSVDSLFIHWYVQWFICWSMNVWCQVDTNVNSPTIVLLHVAIKPQVC